MKAKVNKKQTDKKEKKILMSGRGQELQKKKKKKKLCSWHNGIQLLNEHVTPIGPTPERWTVKKTLSTATIVIFMGYTQKTPHEHIVNNLLHDKAQVQLFV